jgi:hypothetical protein
VRPHLKDKKWQASVFPEIGGTPIGVTPAIGELRLEATPYLQNNQRKKAGGMA